MKDKLLIIPCGKKKVWDNGVTKGSVRAADAYKGTMFKLGVRYAEALNADWVILSAKYGYIRPADEIEPYDVTFKKKSSNPITYKEMHAQLSSLNLSDYNEIIALGGTEYRNAIVDSFACGGRSDVLMPFAGLSMGSYLHELKEAIKQEIINSVYIEYTIPAKKTVYSDNRGNLSFCENYWRVPKRENVFEGWLEGPPQSKQDREWVHFDNNVQREALLGLGPKPGAWAQVNEITCLVGKRLLIQMIGNCWEDPYPMEASFDSLHFDRDREGFLRCYMCLTNIVHLDTGKNGADGMYNGSRHITHSSAGLALLSLEHIGNISVIENPDEFKGGTLVLREENCLEYSYRSSTVVDSNDFEYFGWWINLGRGEKDVKIEYVLSCPCKPVTWEFFEDTGEISPDGKTMTFERIEKTSPMGNISDIYCVSEGLLPKGVNKISVTIDNKRERTFTFFIK